LAAFELTPEAGLVPVSIHHEAVIRASADQNAVNTDRHRCRYLEDVPADRQETQDCNGGCSFDNFPFHFFTSWCLEPRALSVRQRFSARAAE
jgi:hypothetical protein